MSDKIKVLLQAEISPDSINKIQSQINGIQSTSKPVEVKVNTTSAVQSLEKLEQVTKKNLSLDLDRLSNRYKNLVQPADVSKVREMIGALEHTDPKLGHNIDLIRVKMKEMSVGAEQSRKAIDMANKSAMSFGEGVKIAMSKFLIWSGVTVAYYGFVRAVKSGIITVKELDSAMLELRKVTDETESTYDKFTDTAFRLGKELGRTGIEAVQATADFARMGYGISQATELAEQALLMVNVGDGIENLEHATSSMIATLKGYGVAAEDVTAAAIHMNDAYNEVANNFATTTGSLTQGVQRASAVLSQAGTSFNETLGLLTGGDEVLQDIRRVSTGLVTITQRLRGIDESGEAIEGLVPQLNKAFNDIGITLEDTNGNLKDTYSILESLAEVFPTLTSKQQAYISELTSGKRQAPVLQAILSNWESVAAATETAANSAGSALAENEKYLESMEGKLKIFSSSVQLFWNTALNSDSMKSLIDFGTSFMTLLTDSTERLGLFNTVLSVAIPLIGVKLVKSFRATYIEMMKLHAVKKMTLLPTPQSIGLVIKSMLGFKTAVEGATVATTGLTVATIGLTAGLLAVPMLINAIVTAEQRRKRAMEESLDAFKKQQEVSTNMTELISDYEELADKSKLTTEESEKLLNVKNKIKELIPESTAVIDNENISLGTQIELLEKLNEEELERFEQKAHEQLSRGSRTHEREMRELEEKTQRLEEWKLLQKELSEGYLAGTLSSDDAYMYKYLTEQIPELQKEIETLTESTEAYEVALAYMTGGMEAAKETMANFGGGVKSSNEPIEETIPTLEELDTSLSNTIAQMDNFSNSMSSLDNAYAQLISNNQLTVSDLVSLQDQFGDVTGFDDFINTVGTATSVTKEVQDAFDSLLSSYLETNEMLALLDEGNKDLIISQLKLIGVTNAEEIANELLANRTRQLAAEQEALAIEKDFLTKKGYELTDATWEEINAFINQQDASEDIKESLARLALEKINLNETQLNFSSDIDQVIALANAAGASIEALARLERAKNVFSQASTFRASSGMGDFQRYQEAERVMEQVNSGIFDFQFTPLNANAYKKATYIGGSKTRDTIDKAKKSGSSSKPKEEKAKYDYDKDLKTLESFLLKYIKKRGELEKKAIDDWYKKEIEALDKLHKAKIDAYNEDLQKYKDVADEKIRLITDTYDEENYYEDLSKEKEEERRIQSQIDKLALDDSSRANDERRRLRELLAQQVEKIADMERSREKDLKIQAYRDAVTIKENEVNNLIDQENKLYEDSKAKIEATKDIRLKVWEKSYDDAAVYAEASKAISSGLVKDFNGKMVSVKNAYVDFENRYGSGMGILGDKTKKEFLATIDRVNLGMRGLKAEAGYLGTSVANSMNKGNTAASNLSSGISRVGTSARNATNDIKKLNAELDKTSKKTSPQIRSIGIGNQWLMSYDDGGKIDYTGIANVHGTPSKPEYVFNYPQFRDLAKYKAHERSRMPAVATASIGGMGQGIKIGNLIEIKGDVTHDVLPLLEKEVDKGIIKLRNMIEKQVGSPSRI